MNVYQCPVCTTEQSTSEMLPQISVGKVKDVPQMQGMWFCQQCGYQEDSQNSPILISETQFSLAIEAVLPLLRMEGELNAEQKREVTRKAVQLSLTCRDALDQLFE